MYHAYRRYERLLSYKGYQQRRSVLEGGEAYSTVHNGLHHFLALLLRNGCRGDGLLPLKLHVGHAGADVRSRPWSPVVRLRGRLRLLLVCTCGSEKGEDKR